MIDVLIVGGSFAGLAAGLQLVRTGRQVTVLDTKLPRNRFTHAAHGLLGFDGANPGDIRARGEADFLKYPTARIVRAEAVSARRIDGGFAITDTDGVDWQAPKMILAYGVTDVMPALPGFAECWGKSVVPCPYCDGYEVANQRLGVLYSGPMSTHVAALIRDWSADMTFLLDGNPIGADDRAQLEAKGIRIVDGKVDALIHRDGAISHTALADGTEVLLDALFAHPRNAPSSSIHLDLGIETMDGPAGPYIKVDGMQQTNVPGVFAAGDSANPMNSLTNAIAGGVMAGIVCHRSLVFPEH